MVEWKTSSIEELCKRVVSGGTPTTTNRNYYENGTVPWMKTGEIHQRYIQSTETLITEEGLKKSSAKLIPKDSVIVAMYGDGGTAGKVAINKIPLATNQACCNLIVDDQKIEHRYLYFYLKINYNNLVALKLGGSQQNLNGKTIKDFEVKYPPLPIQRKIASILSAYDELIENNNQRIQLLETMAEEIYKEWFIRLRFPGYQDTPVVDGVPEGWDKVRIDDAFEIVGGGTPSTDIAEFWEGNVNWFSPTDITGSAGIFLEKSAKQITELGLKKSSAKLFPAHSVMVTSRATIGAVGINTTSACTNQGFITCLPNKAFPYPFIYEWIKTNKGLLENFSSGATFKEISRGVFKKLKIINPPTTVSQQYYQLVKPMFDDLRVLQQKNQVLQETRDLLLPRLISGKLSVEHLLNDDQQPERVTALESVS